MPSAHLVLPLLCLLLLLLPSLATTPTSPYAVRQAASCPNRCVRNRNRARTQCSTRQSACRVKRCRLSATRRGYRCAPRASNTATQPPTTTRSTTTAISTPPPAFVPRYKKAVICRNGMSVYNVGIIDIDDMLHIAMFAVTEETATEYLNCIKQDQASVSVEEYLHYAYNHCIGESEMICPLTNNQRTCACNTMPIRCVYDPFKRAVNNCNLIG